MRLITARITVNLPFRTSVEEGKPYPRIEKDLGNGGKVIIHPFEFISHKGTIHTGYVDDYRKIMIDVILPYESDEIDFSKNAHRKPFIDKADEYLKLFLLHCKPKSKQFWWQPISFGSHNMSEFDFEMKWMNENGDTICEVKGKQGANFVLGVGINEEIWESVKNDMAGDIPPSIVDFHLEEARYAVFAGNKEILIVNTAIALEIFTKRFCNEYAKAKGRETDLNNLLSEQGKNGFVSQYFKKIIPQLTSNNFESKDKNSYQSIDYLFRTRNKIAHEGKTCYKNDGGKEHLVDFDEAHCFFLAADKVMNWLRNIDSTIAEKLRCFAKINNSSIT